MSTVLSHGGRPARPRSWSSLREVLGETEYTEALLADRSMMDFDRVSFMGLLATEDLVYFPYSPPLFV